MINDGESPAQSAPAPTKQRRIDNLLRIADDDSVNNFARSICGEAARFLSTQSAPAQEPVATLEAKVSTLLARALTTGYGSTEAIYALANLAREPLYAAPPPDEARELMLELYELADVDPLATVEEAKKQAEVFVRVRAYLEQHK